MWSQPGLRLASLLYVDGHFVCLSEDGVLRLVKATEKTYVEVAKAIVRERARRPAAAASRPAWAAPILSHGLLYVRGDDRLVCLRLIPGGSPSPLAQGVEHESTDRSSRTRSRK